jgi:hypothetical protein
VKVWRMPSMCDSCPFARTGAGAHLRRTLRRWRAILADMKRDKHFLCHKTTDETGEGSNLHCAGSIIWQMKHNGRPSQCARIAERLYGEPIELKEGDYARVVY